MKKLLLAFSVLLTLGLFFAFPVSAVALAAEQETEPPYIEYNTETENSVTEQDENFDWSVWFKEKVMPVLISVGAGIVTICSFLYPVLYSVNGGVKLFKKSKSEFDNVTQRVVETQNEITEFKSTSLARIGEIAAKMRDEIGGIKDKNTTVLDEYGQKLAEQARALESVIRIMKIAFGNNAELVKNGYANEIMKIGGENDTQTETSGNSATNP